CAALCGCGGDELGAYRHVDAPGDRDAGSTPIRADAGAPVVTEDAGLGCGEHPAVLDWESPLSCDGFEGCTVKGVRLATSDGAHAFGIASAADGSDSAVWERVLDRTGAVESTLLLSGLNSFPLEPAKPDLVIVREVE